LGSAKIYDPAGGPGATPSPTPPPRPWLRWPLISFRCDQFAARRRCCAQGRCWWRGSGSSVFYLSSAEVYDPCLGFDPNWQLTTVAPSILPDCSALFKQVPNECSLQQGLAFGVFARTWVSRNLRRKKHSNNSGFLPIPPNFVALLSPA